MNRCYSLAVDAIAPGPHVTVRVHGHGALLGTLILRREELDCFKTRFYSSDPPRRVQSGRWLAGDIPHEEWSSTRPARGRWSERLTRDVFVTVTTDAPCKMLGHD